MTWRAVFRHEWRLLLADRVLGIGLLGFLVLFGYALANGVAWRDFSERNVAAALEASRDRTASLATELEKIAGGGRPSSPFRDPRRANVAAGPMGARAAVLDPGPLTALAVGQSDLLPYVHDVSLYTNESSFLQNGEVENPLNLMVGRFDAAFFVIYLLPLLVLALSFRVLSGEREQGTLALALAQPVSARRLVSAKLAFRALVVVGMAVGVSLLGAFAAEGAAAADRILLWCGTVTAYALFWFALAAWANSLGRSSAWNATVLVGAWLLLVVVLPAGLNIAADLLHPLPSRVEMVTTQREASNDAVNRRSELLARYLEDHPEMAEGVVDASENFAALAWAATEAVNERLEEVTTRYDERLEAQRELTRRYRFLSPALLAQEALLDAAGTGDARFWRFQAQVRTFAEEWRQFFVPKLLAGDEVSVDVLEAAPHFRFEDEDTDEVVRRAGVPLGVLVLLLGIVTGAAVVRLGRIRGAA